jgi:hypothetical protein
MSFAHLLLKKVAETTDAVEYSADSPDFSEDRSWQPVARIVIRKAAKDYDFLPLNDWVGMNLVDPKLYGLPETERAAILKSNPPKYCGAWTGRIHEWTSRLIEQEKFPASYPS